MAKDEGKPVGGWTVVFSLKSATGVVRTEDDLRSIIAEWLNTRRARSLPVLDGIAGRDLFFICPHAYALLGNSIYNMDITTTMLREIMAGIGHLLQIEESKMLICGQAFFNKPDPRTAPKGPTRH